MMEAILQQITTLQATSRPFALATVVRSEKPTSARPGDRAVIHADGTLEGWIGGSCAQPVVVREALKAISDGQPRLIGLMGEGVGQAREGMIAYPMSCHSGGTLEIFIEPFLPPPTLAIVGQTPIARALANIGASAAFQVALHEQLEPEPQLFHSGSYVIIATQGGDEAALLAALRSAAPYIGLVASRQRAAALVAYLRDSGIEAAALQRLKAPAGLDIGATTPDEIALSILAEVVQVQHRGRWAEADSAPVETAPVALGRQPAIAIDPVCGMEVAISAAQHSAVHTDTTYYFCCPGCRGRFVKNPLKFLEQEANERTGSV
jgi:xanthine dehydrogenase accessory factor